MGQLDMMMNWFIARSILHLCDFLHQKDCRIKVDLGSNDSHAYSRDDSRVDKQRLSRVSQLVFRLSTVVSTWVKIIASCLALPLPLACLALANVPLVHDSWVTHNRGRHSA